MSARGSSPAPRLERVVADQLRHAGLGLEGRHRRLGDLRQLHHHRLDLDQLDAVAADLHLGVDAAQILDLAGVVDAAEVAGAVDALGGVVGDADEVRNELLGRQLLAVEIAGGDADAAMPISPNSPRAMERGSAGSRITIE